MNMTKAQLRLAFLHRKEKPILSERGEGGSWELVAGEFILVSVGKVKSKRYVALLEKYQRWVDEIWTKRKEEKC